MAPAAEPRVREEPPVPTAEIAAQIALGRLMGAIGQDPKYRGRLMEIVSEAVPGAVIPEVEMRKQLDERVKATTEPVLETSKKIGERLDRVEHQLARQRFADEHGLSDEELEEVQVVARENQIGKPEAAVEFWRAQSLGKPRGSTSPGGAELTAESKKALYANPRKWYEAEAERVLQEIRSPRRRRGA